MKQYKITPSLYTAWQWHLKLEKPMQELVDTLERKRFETNEAMQAGIDFEDAVERLCETGKTPLQDYFSADSGDSNQHTKKELSENEQKKLQVYSDCVHEVAEIVKGGDWQDTVYEELYLPAMDIKIQFKGRTDVIKLDTIHDIKFVKNYEIGKYSGSIQHLIYMYCTGLEKFQYVISDGKAVYVESYFSDNTTEILESKLGCMITEFLMYLQNTEFEGRNLMDIYKKHWSV